MEDQSADSGDLTADATVASMPQGKAARNRHRLPRQKAQQPGDPGEAGDEPTNEESAAASEPTVAAENTESTESAIATVPKSRRRLRWRRSEAVTGDAAALPAEETVVEPPAPADVEAPGQDTAVPELDTEVQVGQAEAPQPVLVPHRPAGRVLKIIAVAAGALFVAAGAFAGATIEPYLNDRAAVQTKFLIAETAANAITTLWTYTPDDMDQLPERSAKYLGGDFASDYKRYIDAIVAPNKQAQVSNNTQVLGAAVESLTSTEATAIVYTNSVATSPVTKGIPSLRYLSYRLTMKRQDNRWLITQMVAVTKLDLTPRL